MASSLSGNHHVGMHVIHAVPVGFVAHAVAVLRVIILDYFAALVWRAPAIECVEVNAFVPAAYRRNVLLGKTRGKLFRKGGLKQDQFVDFNGDELTLDELRQLHPGAFEKAGVE